MNRIKDVHILRDLACCREEYTADFHDKFQRFTHYQSKNRDIFTPVVSNYLHEQGYKPTYPDNKPFAVCLTHDIDSLYSSYLSRGYHLALSLLNKDKAELIRYLKSLINRKKPLTNLTEIMDLEEKYHAKSSFYMMALKPGERDFNYDIEDFRDLIREIDAKGWEIGLHGGHEAWNSLEILKREKKRLEDALGKEIIGYRNHYLHFKVPDTWEILHKAGIKYDATLGYADCAGFRNGMCHPYYPYNLNTRETIEIMEIPLIVMDGTLFGYMRLERDDAFRLVTELIDAVEKVHGVFTLLWHNSYLIEGTWQREMYERILEYCYQKNAWMTSGYEIWKWVSGGNDERQ